MSVVAVTVMVMTSRPSAAQLAPVAAAPPPAERPDRRDIDVNAASLANGDTKPSKERHSLGVTTTVLQPCCRDGRKSDPLDPLTGRGKGPFNVGAAVRLGNAGSSLSVGIVGTRDYRLPLYMSTLLGGADVPRPAVSSLTDMSRGAMNWQLVGSVKQTLFTSPSGATIGIVGDVVVPLGPEATAAVPHAPVVPSRVARIGLTLGF